MSTKDFLRPSGCRCPSTSDMLRSSMERTPLALCPLHQADEIARREAEAVRAKNAADLHAVVESFKEVRESLKAKAPECSCIPLARALTAMLSGKPPSPCPVHDAPTAPTTTALNDPSLVDGLTTPPAA